MAQSFDNSRRRFGAAALAAGTIGLASPVARAQSYPSRPIKIIVPFGPGGAAQNLSERVGREIANELGQPFIPDYRGGAAGLIAAEAVAKADPDGYTLLLGVPSAMSVAPTIMRSATKFDPMTAFLPISMLATTPFVLFVNANVPAQDFPALIAHAKANPGKLNFGSIGANGTDYIAGDVLQKATGTRMTNIPYKSVSALLLDAVAGRVDVAILSPIPIRQFVDQGKLRILAVTSSQRSPAPSLKDVPTVAEQGVPGYEILSWYGYFAPAGTPAEVVTRVNAATQRAVAKPDIQSYLLSQGLSPLQLSPAQFKDYYEADSRRWVKFIRDANIPIE
ncbi:MAG: Bug family tripartite tricarboxylate transporter substrate binding protein [Burkholderiaceae bacterium]